MLVILDFVECIKKYRSPCMTGTIIHLLMKTLIHSQILNVESDGMRM